MRELVGGEKPTPDTKTEKLTNLNPVAQAAQKAGVVNCLTRMNQVVNFLTTGSQQSGAKLSIAPKQPNEQIASSTLEIQTPNVLSYASADFAPTSEGGCSGTYEAVVYWPSNCEAVARTFSGFKPTGAIKSNIFTLQGSSAQLRVFLIPAGTAGCVSIKKEIIYQD
jgi:hypothetical protein